MSAGGISIGARTLAGHGSSRPREGAAGDPRRRELDGLRGIAVLLVLAFHAWPRLVPGGAIGVDLFFVLSGLLVTGSVLGAGRDGRQGRVPGLREIRAFWGRRVRRLLPALMVVLLVMTAASASRYPDLPARLRSQWLAALTGSTNWMMLLRGDDYFTHLEPLMWQHLWSVAIEVQFYLLWPLVIVLAARLTGATVPGRAAAPAALAAAAASASALLVVAIRAGALDLAYLATPTHLFGLLAGSAVALRNLRGAGEGARTVGPTGPRRRRALLVPAGVALLVVIAVALPAEDDVPGATALVLATAVATVLVGILTGPGRPAHDPVLGSRPAVWLGRRSYAVYLWHWPLLVLLHAGTGTAIGGDPWRSALAVGLALLVAEPSWRLVESAVIREGWTGALRRLRIPLARLSRHPALLLLVLVAGASTLLFAGTVLVLSPSVSPLERMLAGG